MAAVEKAWEKIRPIALNFNPSHLASSIVGLSSEDLLKLAEKMSELRKESEEHFNEEQSKIVNTARADAMFGSLSSGMADFYDNEVSAASIGLGDELRSIQSSEDFIKQRAAYEKSLELLKEKVGREAVLTLMTSTRSEELGNMNAHSDPYVAKESIPIVFLGMFGFAEPHGYTWKRPMYIHARKDGKEALYRNNLNVWVEEESGNPTYDWRAEMLSLDDMDIRAVLSESPLNEDEKTLMWRIDADLDNASEETVSDLANSLIKGVPGYGLCPCNPSYSYFDNPQFVGMIVKYFDRIV
jgi:hypothetical protein